MRLGSRPRTGSRTGLVKTLSLVAVHTQQEEEALLLASLLGSTGGAGEDLGVVEVGVLLINTINMQLTKDKQGIRVLGEEEVVGAFNQGGLSQGRRKL